MKQDSSFREIFRLTIPQLGLMLCHLCISMTDLWVAGQLDKGVLASLGIVSQMFTFLMLLTAMIGSGCMATVSQSLGAGRAQRAARYVVLVAGLAFAGGSGVTLLALAVLPLLWYGAWLAPELRPVVAVFAVAYAVQLPFFYTMIILNSVFRAYKQVWLPLCTLLLVAVVNALGSIGLGLGYWGLPALGYPAVAWATAFAALLGFGCNIVLARRQGLLGRSAIAPWRWNRIAVLRLWRIGMPAAVAQLAGQAGNVILTMMAARLPIEGLAATAGLTLGMRIWGLAQFPFAALGMTMTILSGHLLGARQVEAVLRLGRRSAWGAGGLMAVLCCGIWLLREPLARCFAQDAAVIEQAMLFLGISVMVLPLQAASGVLAAILAGAGATGITCRISCAALWAVAVPVALVLAFALSLGATGIYLGLTLGNLCAAAGICLAFQRRSWIRSLARR